MDGDDAGSPPVNRMTVISLKMAPSILKVGRS